jgi:hydroxyethylthiazole kinase-like uncharacterized protein yjeF
VELLSAEESRRLDRLTQDKFGVPSYSLMSRAGEAVARAIAKRWRRASVLVVAGKGNNGGDGMVVARRLHDDGVNVRTILLARVPSLKGDAALACREYLDAGGEVHEIVDERSLAAIFVERADVIVDAIFGTGLNAAVAGLPRRAIESINQSDAAVVAVDIASGVNSDTGAIMGVAVKAALTVTFGLAKFGHFSYPGAGLCGELEIADIGFAPAAIDEIAPRGRWLERGDLLPLMHPRLVNSHKGMFGHTLVIAGSRGKGGAPLLSARAALRMGAGLVTVAIPESVATIVGAGQAEIMTEPMPDRDGHFDAEGSIRHLTGLIEGKDAIAVGPGIGVSEDTRRLVTFLIEKAAGPDRPLLIDADGLNALAQIDCGSARRSQGPVILTPHPGEMARLLNSSTAEVNADRVSAARTLSGRTGAFVLLKGAHSVITCPGGEIYINSTGNPGMGTPGMGDALSGMIASLLGQRMKVLEALALGVFIHGDAADRVARSRGEIGYITGDLIEELPAALTAMLA